MEAMDHDLVATGKNIGFLGGVCLLVNSMTGPALITFPSVIQNAGYLVPFIVVVIFWGISTFSSLALCEAMSRIPGNHRFEDKVELTSLVKYHFGNKVYYTILAILNICLLSLNVASIIATAQAIDFALMAASKHTCGLEFHPSFHFLCIDTAVPEASTPFGDIYILSVGMVGVLLFVVPLGYVNLSKNIIVQILAVISVFAMALLWTIDFARVGFKSETKPVAPRQNDVLGTIMFNFVVGVAIPSWMNEKKLGVNPKKVILTATTLAAALFFYVGILGSFAFHYGNGVTLLTAITECHDCFILTKITAFYLPAAVFLTSIPVYSIIVRYNLIENKICGQVMAFVISVIFPWLLAVPFYSGTGLLTVINWASLFLQSFINFILPMILLIKSKRANRSENSVNLLASEKEESSFAAIPQRVALPIAICIIIFIVIAVIGETILNIL